MASPPSPVPDWMIYSTLGLSVIGLVGNLLIVGASIVSRQLRGRCQLFIAALAATDVVVCIYLVLLRILMIRDWFFVTNRSCYMVSIFGLFALNAQSAIGLILGIDRLFAVMIPLRYQHLPSIIYVILWLSIFVYAVLLTLKDDILPVCLPPTAYAPGAREDWIFASMFIAVLVLVAYSVANIKVRFMAKVATEVSIHGVKRLLSSLNLVMALYFSTWFLTVSMLVLTQVVQMAASTVQMINQQLAWLVIINASLNFFIYFWRTPEYRKAFLYILTCGRSIHPNTPSNGPNSFQTRRSTVNVIPAPLTDRV